MKFSSVFICEKWQGISQGKVVKARDLHWVVGEEFSPVSLAPCLYKPCPGPQEIIIKPQGCCIFLNTTTPIDSHSLQISQDDVFVVILIKNLHSCGLLWRTAGRSQFNSIVLLKQLFHVSPSPRHGAQGAVSVAIIELETRRGDYPSPVVILRRQKIRKS